MYTFEGRIRYSEIGSEGKLTMESLIDYFQDCSTFQAEFLGIGLGYLEQNEMFWVLNSWQIDVKRYPGIYEKVTIGTLPYQIKGFLGFRNFALKDENGDILAIANSIWTLLNTKTLKPVLPTPYMKQQYEIEPKLDMEYLDRKIAIPEGGKIQEQITIEHHHLDTNHHVNNGQYVRMAAEYLPENFEIGRLRAEYKKSALLNEIVQPIVTIREDAYIIELNNTAGEPYAVIEFTKQA